MFYLLMLVPVILMLPFIIHIYRKIKQLLMPYKHSKIIALGVSVLLMLTSTNIFSIGFILVLHFVCLSWLVDLCVFIYKKRKPLSTKLQTLHRYLVFPTVMTALILAYGYINMNTVHEKSYTIETDKDLEREYNFVYLSDVHYGISLDKQELEAYVNKINEKELDFVLLGGDIVDESTTYEGVLEVFEVLSKIESKYGTYFVYGNHDESNYTFEANYTNQQLEDAIVKNGITILNDEVVEVGEEITLVGRLDYSYRVREGMNNLLQGKDLEDFILVLDHQPKGYAENNEAGVDLEISGHTHGGQIFPLGIFIDLFKTSDMCYGYTKIDDFQAIVSSGFAGWGYPIRTERQCEYVLVTLQSTKG